MPLDNRPTETQAMMVETARRVVREHIIAPRADMALDQSGAFPHAIFRALWEAGLANLEVPQEAGGAGLGCLDHVLVQEELHYGCLGIGTAVTANSLAAMPLILAQKPALAQRFLAPLIHEPRYAAYACSEPDAGSDVAALSCRYVRAQDHYVLDGIKRWITNGDVASWAVVFAREAGTAGHRGIAAFVVPTDTPGLRAEGLVHKLGQRASHTCDLVLTECAVPAELMLVGPQEGFRLAMNTFDRTRPYIAAAAAAVIRRARDEALRYSHQRKTFGKLLAEHQLVQGMLANMEVSYRAARLMCHDAALEVDRGHLRGVHSACAKLYGADAAMRCTLDAVQIFGGYGYTTEFVVEKLMRDAKLLQIYEGASEVQKMVIARDLSRAELGRSA